MSYTLSWLILALIRLLQILLIVYVVLSYVLKPWHPIRQWVDRLVEPLLTPIRRLVPPMAGMDFSPLVLLLIVQIVATLLLTLLQNLPF